MIEFSRRIPTSGGSATVEAGRDGVTLALYGRQGGFLAGASFAIGMAPCLGAALREAEGVVLHNLEPEPAEDLSAVPWLGTN